MIFTKQARKNAKGVWFAPGKADVAKEGYFERADYLIYKLCENYDGQVRGGIRKTWRVVAQNLTLDEAKTLLEKKIGKGKIK